MAPVSYCIIRKSPLFLFICLSIIFCSCLFVTLVYLLHLFYFCIYLFLYLFISVYTLCVIVLLCCVTCLSWLCILVAGVDLGLGVWKDLCRPLPFSLSVGLQSGHLFSFPKLILDPRRQLDPIPYVTPWHTHSFLVFSCPQLTALCYSSSHEALIMSWDRPVRVL